MSNWPVVLVKGLDSFRKFDLLRYLAEAGGRPVTPAQAAGDLGYSQAEVVQALRDLVGLGIVASSWRDGGSRFMLAAPAGARRAIDDLLSSWVGARRRFPRIRPEGSRGEAT